MIGVVLKTFDLVKTYTDLCSFEFINSEPLNVLITREVNTLTIVLFLEIDLFSTPVD